MRRRGLLAGTAALALTLGLAAEARADDLTHVRFAFAQTAVSPIITNIVIPTYLGYYEEEGLEVEIVPMGTNPAVMANMEAGRVEFSVGVPTFQLPLVAGGEDLPAINFFEYAYPFKWDVAVRADSDIQELADLEGKIIGVSSFGTSDYPIGQIMVRRAGLDPDVDVEWLAVGAGTTAGQAVDSGEVDALLYWDTGFGAIEAAGIELRYLPRPEGLPMVGGLYLTATRAFLDEHPQTAIGFARAVAKAQAFAQENPEAAAYAFLQLYPEAASRAASLQEQVEALMVPIVKRQALYNHYDPSVPRWGYISPEEWEDEVAFNELEGQIEDPSIFYTNELIEAINDFDEEAVRQQARDFKLPYEG